MRLRARAGRAPAPGEAGSTAPKRPRPAHLSAPLTVHRHTPAWRLVPRALCKSPERVQCVVYRFLRQFSFPPRRSKLPATSPLEVFTFRTPLPRVSVFRRPRRRDRRTRPSGERAGAISELCALQSSLGGCGRERVCARPLGGRRHAVPAAARVRVLRAVRLLPAVVVSAATAPASSSSASSSAPSAAPCSPAPFFTRNPRR